MIHAMRTSPIALAVVIAVATCAARAVQPGDLRDAVVAELGRPTGKVAMGGVETWYYPRGQVRLRDGRVFFTDLMSDADLAARTAAEEAAQLRIQKEQQQRLAQLTEEGQAALAGRKSDPTFVLLSAAEQLAYWKLFAVRYPMISLENELVALRQRIDDEQRLRELDRINASRVAELQSRLAVAEARTVYGKGRRSKKADRRRDP